MRNPGKTMKLLLLDGVPSGRVKCTLANWMGVAYKIPRVAFEQCEKRSDFANGGVFLLFGAGESRKSVQIGLAEPRRDDGIYARICCVDSDWSEVVVFTTPDNSLTYIDIYYLEHELRRSVIAAERYEIVDSLEPGVAAPSEEKRCELDEYLDIAELAASTLGCKVFESVQPDEEPERIYVTVEVPVEVPVIVDVPADPVDEPIEAPDDTFYFRQTLTDARGAETPDGFIVFAGSQIRKDMAPDTPTSIAVLREKHKNLVDRDGYLLEDILFTSPSLASAFVLGTWTKDIVDNNIWHTSDGRTINSK